eukprot:PhM_4_TR18064/c1_g1_i13/m.101883
MSTNTGQSMSTTKTLKTSSSDVSDTTTSAASSTSSPFRRCYSPKNRNRKRKNEAEQNSDDDDHNDDENGALLFQDIDDDYRIRPYSLRFCSDTVEERFIRHFYNLRNYPARGVYFIWCVLISVGFEVMTALRNQSRHVTGILLHIATISTLVSFVLLIRAGHRGQTLPGNKHEAAIAALCLPVIFAALISRHVSEGYVHSIPFIAAVATHIVGTLRFRVFGYAVPLTITLSTVIFNAREGLDVRYYLWPLCSYVAVILHYMLERQLRTEYTAIDKSEVQLVKINQKTMIMQAALVNAFPPTVARLLSASAKATTQNTDSPPSSPRSAIRNMNRLRSGHMYPNTVLVVTDAAGFTAWATRTDASVVIRVLGRMLAEFDDAAHARGVEKVGTVGDSFVGAVFGCDADDARATGRKVLRALHFAIDVVRLPHQLNFPLRNRVGVHVGDVFGGFVGLSPPVFDVFGRAVSEAKHLESSGEPSRVHVSERALRVCEECGCGRAVDVTPTPLGSVISNWDCAVVEQCLSPSAAAMNSDSGGLIGRVVAFAESTKKESDVEVDEASVTAGVMNLMRRRVSLASNARGSVIPSVAPAFSKFVSFPQHPVFRNFLDPKLESQFSRYTHSKQHMKAQRHVLMSLGIIYYICLVLFVLFGQGEVNDNRWIGFIVLVTISVWYALMILGKWSTMHALALTLVAFYICTLSLIFIRTHDDDDDEEEEEEDSKDAVQNIIVVSAPFRFLAPNVMGDVRLRLRVVLTILCAAVNLAHPSLRSLSTSSKLISIDSFILVQPIIVLIVSFGLEASLRAGFVAQKRVKLCLSSSSEYASVARTALESMLPTFVADAMLERDTNHMLRREIQITWQLRPRPFLSGKILITIVVIVMQRSHLLCFYRSETTVSRLRMTMMKAVMMMMTMTTTIILMISYGTTAPSLSRSYHSLLSQSDTVETANARKVAMTICLPPMKRL